MGLVGLGCVGLIQHSEKVNPKSECAKLRSRRLNNRASMSQVEQLGLDGDG